jgi:enamine deaminase RidA (YjgF/YER057c/UK114 family)
LCFVTDLERYTEARPRLAAGWKERLGRHYPAMSLVKVAGLVEPGAVVELEATAQIPDGRPVASGGAG